MITAIGGSIAGVFRWGFNRLVKALDDNTTMHLRTVEKLTEVSVKVDQVWDWVGEHTPVEIPESRRQPSSTLPYGPRPGTKDRKEP